jgi:hypothetical protein
MSWCPVIANINTTSKDRQRRRTQTVCAVSFLTQRTAEIGGPRPPLLD